LSSAVGEEPEPDDLVGHPGDRVPGVGVREADEQQKAALDPTGDPVADAHFGAGDSLEEDAHTISIGDEAKITGDLSWCPPRTTFPVVTAPHSSRLSTSRRRSSSS
jgi:hypothetical protein